MLPKRSNKGKLEQPILLTQACSSISFAERGCREFQRFKRDLSLNIRQLFQRRSAVQEMRELVAQLLGMNANVGQTPKG